MSYLDELSHELAAVGIRGRLRARILAETDDHLRSGGEAGRFGSPREVANAFAAELGTEESLAAARHAFAALAVAGAVYAAAFVSMRFAGGGLGRPAPPLGDLAAAAIVLAPQVAFAAGCLALLRALRRRRARVLPSAELAVVNRRTGTALSFGLVAMGAFVGYAVEAGGGLPGWWTTLVYAGCGGSALLLAAAAAPVAAAARLRPQVAGDAGDLFDDLPLARYRGDPWRFARHVAFAVFALTTAAGVVGDDPFDGALRGAAEAFACLGGFWALGRFLGLRR